MSWILSFGSRYREQLGLLVLVIGGLIMRLRYVFDPVRYDEAYTYFHFAKYSFVRILTDYSLPNNHVLHTLLVKISIVFLGVTEFALRFPALLAGIAMIVVGYFFARTYLAKIPAFLFSSILAFSHYAIFYSINARGYTLSALLLIGAALLVTRLMTMSTRSRSIILGLLSGLLLVTVPSNAPFVVALYGYWVLSVIKKRRYSALPHIFTSGFLGILVTLVGYSGIIAQSGVSAIVGNNFVSRLSYSQFFSQLGHSLNEWFVAFTLDIPIFFAFLILVLWGVGFVTQLRRCGLSAIFFVVTSVWFLIFAVLPPARVLFPLLPFFFLLVIDGYLWLINKGQISSRVSLMVAFVLFVGSFFSRFTIHELPETGYFPYHREACHILHEISTRNDRVKLIEGDTSFDFCFFRDEVDYYEGFSGKVFWIYPDTVSGNSWMEQNLQGVPYVFER
jgi:Dolichyl-phosphate-mannose-protein mannosyltransferase